MLNNYVVELVCTLQLLNKIAILDAVENASKHNLENNLEDVF